MSLNNLKKAIDSGKLVIGTNSTIKALKFGNAKEVFVTKNCPERVKNRIKNYSKDLKIPYNEIKENSEELGAICKKSFFINSCYY